MWEGADDDEGRIRSRGEGVGLGGGGVPKRSGDEECRRTGVPSPTFDTILLVLRTDTSGPVGSLKRLGDKGVEILPSLLTGVGLMTGTFL